MKKENSDSVCCSEHQTIKCHHSCGGGGSCATYGFGVVGALFYFLEGVSGFSAIIMGIGKSIVWPALLVFELLGYFKI